MSFISALEAAGHAIANFFTKAAPVVQEIQEVATPFENMFVPGLSQAINIGLTAVMTAESQAVLAGSVAGSGATKLASVIGTVATQLGPTLTALGVDTKTVTSDDYTKFINAIVTAANVFKIAQVPVTATPVVTTPVAA